MDMVRSQLKHVHSRLTFPSIGRLSGLVMFACTAASAPAQWAYEVAEANMQSRAAVNVGVAGDGTVAVMFSGFTDGNSCDGTADVYVKVRISPNNWVEPPASYTPNRLRCTRPFMVVNDAGDIFICYELRWANYTGIMKLKRTGPTTWVRDGDPILIKAPGTVACGANDPNLPNNAWMYGYNPKMAVAADGSLHVLASHDGGCAYAYNSGANWRTGWSLVRYFPSSNGDSVATDSNSDAHLGMTTANEDPNLNDNYYAKSHNGTITVGPIAIADGGSRTSNTSIAIKNSTALMFAQDWNYAGAGNVWNAFLWQINGTIVSGPTQVTTYPSNIGLNGQQILARSDFVRYIWRTDASDARWIWWYLRAGFPLERITSPGHDPAQMHAVMDATGNLHGAILDFNSANAPNYYWYIYVYRKNDEPPQTGPHGTIAGVVRDQFGVPVPNAAVAADKAAITTSAPNGSYSLYVPVGTYTVQADKTYYSTSSIPGVAVTENNSTALDVTINGNPPGPVTAFAATAGNTLIKLNWTNPASPNFTGTMIRYKIGGFPLSPTDGTQLTDTTGTTFTHANLTNGTKIYYAAFTYYQEVSRYYGSGVVTSMTPFGPGDFDHDGDVDQADFGHLQACYSGSTIPQNTPSCQDAKFDGDDDVDQNDFGLFQGCISGPGIAADPHCLP